MPSRFFGNKSTRNVVLEKSFDEYMNGYKDSLSGRQHRGFAEIVNELNERFPDPAAIQTDADKKAFTKIFGEYLQMENILQNYDEFTYLKEFQKIDTSDSDAVEAFKEEHFLTDENIAKMKELPVLSDRSVQDYKSTYNDIREWIRKEKNGAAAEKSSIDWDDITFEVDLLKSQEINLDYILELIFEHNQKDASKEVVIDEIRKTIRSSVDNRSKEELIVDFINSTDLNALKEKTDIIESFFSYAQGVQREEAAKLIAEDGLNEADAKRFITQSLRREYVSENGTDFNSILPKMSPLNPKFRQLKRIVFQKLSAFVEKFRGIGGEL